MREGTGETVRLSVIILNFVHKSAHHYNVRIQINAFT